jgi:hypothetical protein
LLKVTLNTITLTHMESRQVSYFQSTNQCWAFQILGYEVLFYWSIYLPITVLYMTGRSKMNKRFHNMTQYGMLLDGSVSLKIQLIKDTTYN